MEALSLLMRRRARRSTSSGAVQRPRNPGWHSSYTSLLDPRNIFVSFQSGGRSQGQGTIVETPLSSIDGAAERPVDVQQ